MVGEDWEGVCLFVEWGVGGDFGRCGFCGDVCFLVMCMGIVVGGVLVCECFVVFGCFVWRGGFGGGFCVFLVVFEKLGGVGCVLY